MYLKTQFLIFFSVSYFFSTSAVAYAVNRCETADSSKAVCLLFDAADNYFVLGSLVVGIQQTPGTLQSGDNIRPRPIDPNHPLLKIAFGNEIFQLSLEATTATLTSSEGTTSMVCSDDYLDKCPDFQ